MENASKEYLLLFNGITDTINVLEKEIVVLRRIQMQAEELFLESGDDLEKGNLIAL